MSPNSTSEKKKIDFPYTKNVFSPTELRAIVNQIMQIALTSDDIMLLEKDSTGKTAADYGVRFAQLGIQILMGVDMAYFHFVESMGLISEELDD